MPWRSVRGDDPGRCRLRCRRRRRLRLRCHRLRGHQAVCRPLPFLRTSEEREGDRDAHPHLEPR
eukprot:10356452-Heterocapsa_arctica.AAC.1